MTPCLRVTLLASALSTSCLAHGDAPAPPTLEPSAVDTVRVTDLMVLPHATRTIVASEAVAAAVRGLNHGRWWSAAGSRLVPTHRVELLRGDAVVAVFFIGPNSSLDQFPCYSLCSGWWVGVGQGSGDIDRSRYIGLADTQWFRLSRALGL